MLMAACILPYRSPTYRLIALDGGVAPLGANVVNERRALALPLALADLRDANQWVPKHLRAALDRPGHKPGWEGLGWMDGAINTM
jgi:hypothetical protein